MNESIDRLTHAPQRYELLDGTSEIVLGLACLMFSASFWLSARLTVTWHWLAIMLGGCGILWLISTFGTRFVRRKLVYPRTGYMKTRSRPWKPVLLAASACVMAAAASVIFNRSEKSLIPLIVSLSISAAFLAASLLKNVKRFALYAILSVGWGGLVYLLRQDMRSGMSLYYLLLGATLVVAGAGTMQTYVRRTPQQNPEAE